MEDENNANNRGDPVNSSTISQTVDVNMSECVAETRDTEGDHNKANVSSKSFDKGHNICSEIILNDASGKGGVLSSDDLVGNLSNELHQGTEKTNSEKIDDQDFQSNVNGVFENAPQKSASEKSLGVKDGKQNPAPDIVLAEVTIGNTQETSEPGQENEKQSVTTNTVMGDVPADNSKEMPVETQFNGESGESATTCILTNNGHMEDGSLTSAVETDLEKDIVKQRSSTTNTVDIVIKQEPADEGYLKAELLHRGGPIVVYSDDDDDGGSSSSSSGPPVPPIAERLEEVEEDLPSDGEEGRRKAKSQLDMSKKRSRTEGEIFPEELPPMEYLMISPDESVELEPLGVVSGIVDILVVVRADDHSPALFDDSILFVEGRKPLGLIFETFGTVEKPYYSVRFNSAEDIIEKGIEVGQKVYFAPKADTLTKYVFIAELRKIKCDDASWKDDNEVPASHRDYSDDEEERREKRRAQNKNRGITETSEENTVLKRKKKRRPGQDIPPDPSKPRLLPGELNRNPFGTEGQTYNPPSSKQWPPRQMNNDSVRGPRPRGPFPDRPPPSSPVFRPQRPGQPPASFGQNPNWTHRPSMLGQQRMPPFSTSAPPPFSPQSTPPAPFPSTPSGPHPFAANGSRPPPTSQQPSFSSSSPAAAPPQPFTSFSRPPFSAPPMPTFSSPAPQPFHPGNTFIPPPNSLAQQPPSGPPPAPSLTHPSQWPPSFAPQFPPSPSNPFDSRQANFNPSLPPPPRFASNAPRPFSMFNPSQPPPTNSNTMFQRNPSSK